MACCRSSSEDESSSGLSDCEEIDMSCARGQCSRNGKGRGGGCGCSSGSCGSSSGRGSGGGTGMLPFDPMSIEKILLMIFDKFNFRMLVEERTRSAVLVTAGFAIAGGLLGKHVGGKMGAALGGAVGGACGIGVVAISMREAWNDIKYQLSELVELVYDYIAGLELKDYHSAAMFLMSNSSVSSQLASMLITHASSTLGKNIVSTLTNN